MSTLTAWDWFVLVAFLLSVGFGVARGMVRSIFAIGAWVVAFLGTPLAGSLLIQAFSLHSGGLWIYLLAFVLLFVLVRLLGRLVADGLKKVGLGGPDRLLGGLLGVLRALVVVALAAVAASATGMDREPAWTGAVSRPLLDALVAKLEPFLPERVSGVRRT